MLFLHYKDEPGVIGVVGNAMGEVGINIAQMSVGRYEDQALMFLTVDQIVPDEILKKISETVGSDDIKFLNMVE